MKPPIRLLILLSLLFLTCGCFDFGTGPVTPPDGEAEGEEQESGDEGDGDIEGDGSAECGNGIPETGEECDDGNGVDGDGCDGDCTWTCREAGDCDDRNVCNGDETCDTGTHTCSSGEPRQEGIVCLESPRRICLGGECRDSYCGDGFIDTGGGETCETPGVGGCDTSCRWHCSDDRECPDDGNVCNGEEYCDTGAGLCASRNPPPDGTPCGEAPRRICLLLTCQESFCGDGYLDPSVGEECDDGRDGDDADGCRDDCIYSCHDDTECDDGRGCSGDVCDTLMTHRCLNLPSPSTRVCRPAAGDCDADDHCDGSSIDCPEDDLQPGDVVCRPAADLCDVAENCTGFQADCPADAFAPDMTLCRAVLDVCDTAEYCTGSSALCPMDLFEPSATVCRASTGPCDAAEYCSGLSAGCPADVPKTYNYETPALAAASTELSTYPASMARDGSTSTYWFSTATGPPQWIWFDLGSRKCVDGVRVMIYSADVPMTMSIEVSDDAVTWTAVLPGWSATTGNVWLTPGFAATTARYIRLYQTLLARNYGECTEFQAHTAAL